MNIYAFYFFETIIVIAVLLGVLIRYIRKHSDPIDHIALDCGLQITDNGKKSGNDIPVG